MQLASDLPVDPSVNFRGAESPEFADVNSSDATEPCESLKGLRMYLHDRCGLICIEQGFEVKCTGYSGTAIVRLYAA
jgi:hypothetical protein